jgi:hypothetical protein
MSNCRITVLVIFMLIGGPFHSPLWGDEAAFGLPESGVSVCERVILLAIDDQSLRVKENLVLTLSQPNVRQAPVLTPERGNLSTADSMASHFYGTVLHDKGQYRMWYYSVSLRAKPADLKQGPVCYAESDDGIHWTKPSLGQVEIGGSTDNNAILLPDESTQCAAVIIDKDDPDPSRRYKMMYTTLTHTWVFRPAVSADGIHWKTPDGYPTKRFLEMGSFLKFGDRYVVHGQGIGKDAQGLPEGRQGYASTSKDFASWETTYRESFRLPEPKDVKQRGLVGDYPQVHIGIGASSFGNVAVGLYGIWHNPPLEKRRKKGWYGAGLITCDLGLVVSNDGITFREPVKNHVFISGKESPVTPAPGIDDPTILCQANGILNVGDKTLIYHGRWRNATISGVDYYAEVALATLPRDRWGSLHLPANASQGTVWSAPIVLPKNGCNILLNADHAENIVVQLADENGNLLTKYSGNNRGVVQVSKANVNGVKWAEQSLSAMGGKTVRLKIGLSGRETRLYAVYLDARK